MSEGKIIQINESEVLGHLDTVVRKTGKETLNRMLDAEAEAVEAFIRGTDAHFTGRMDELRLIYMATQVGKAGAGQAAPDMIARIRPFNDRIYGPAADLIRQDQEAGRADPNLDARRHVFLAHMAIVGLLTMEGMIASMDTAPLIHPHQAMVDDLVRTFTARLAAGIRAPAP